jgi:hypothetical protein
MPRFSAKACWVVAILASMLFGFHARATDAICPPPAPLAEDEDFPRMGEERFTQEAYESSLGHLKEFPGRIVDAVDLRRTVQSSETWIGYHNSLRIVEGWVLKQAALRDLEAKRADGPAIQRFCAFVASAHYSD